MRYYDKIYVSQDIDVNNGSKRKQCIVCHYWYFVDKGFNIINRTSKREAASLLQNADLNKKKWINIKYNFSLVG